MRREGAPIPLKPLKRWDNGRDVLLAGDAAGVVAPASGEGIYYAMLGGRLAAEAAEAFLATGKPSALAPARSRFMSARPRLPDPRHHAGFWYRNDALRERFVAICSDRDVQRLTWESYMNKELVRAKPAGACADLLQGSRPPVPLGLAMSVSDWMLAPTLSRPSRRSWWRWPAAS